MQEVQQRTRLATRLVVARMTEPVAVEGALGREPDALAVSSQSVAASAPPAAAAPTANEATMGTGVGEAGGVKQEEPNVSWQDIKSVQNLIERCLQKFMTQTEIIAALQARAKGQRLTCCTHIQ